ncbi:MAG: ACP S-malonyltransferase [Pseudodesulfovibrio sp.]|uniref:Malonyl CoA-acyl carrier protein transacylase n=1 Tax=Pseudodesulfovibrio aespoeensis (strain ATCC 700646 / DSM 10631 / Aspo-2) TaxID=643562 RepID=E6VR75_PSEA9|nr:MULTISPECIES: ACP S-malonyltransferase [Pseudodesulfovibrio]MBU4245173.1 ACP S-malonyltransferase [Pseudomonadota bacterium]ADU64159.1 Acyl transferase [Pseudodesulfovibrio aespoeensis Aspo-2]MBU4378773.1 ACP S-malonyltransferase [Pseudomonadota bacterium]MBU4475479.1 ACP S-malonyltransferase [Pseudomonadota bacterium]MBU4517605.1 ACP S-malonyltransferase [Pseudomonadota bacterium]
MNRTAILFPGQGSQEQGMGRDVAESRDEAMDLWLFAERESGLPLREIYWDGGSGDMADTRALQPALTVVNLSLWLAARDRLTPVAAAGHSLGEFAALAASGALDGRDAIRAVCLRGRLMAEAGGEGHGMAAVVKLDQTEVERIVDQAASDTGRELRIANYNSPGQFVISGEREPLEAAAALVKEAKGRAIPLAVSGAFHSPLIREAADEFAAFLAGLTWKSPTFLVHHNATALPEPDPAGIALVMQRQMTSSVLWIQTIQTMWLAGVRHFAEVGPKNVLTKLLAPNLKDMTEAWTSTTIGSLEQAASL